MTRGLLLVLIVTLIQCTPAPSPERSGAAAYFDNSGREDVLSGGVRLIPITTPKGTFRVWTKRIGNNP
ncbi:MAG TPA: hypothetical protein VGA78_06505, partial [Gemmatimonadales bacterium]